MMAPSSREIPEYLLMPPCIVVDCLLPNSVIVPLSCPCDITLSQLKTELWREAKKYPLYRVLGKEEEYILVGVTQDAELEEFWDEKRRLCDLDLFSPILKVLEPRGKKEDKVLNYEISLALGRPVHELDDTKDEEIHRFRQDINKVVETAIEYRQRRGLESVAEYEFPSDLEPTAILPYSLDKHLDQGYLHVTVWRGNTESTSIRVAWDGTIVDIIDEALNKLPPPTEDLNTSTASFSSHCPTKYALKVCGSNEYLLSNHPITQFKTIRRWVARGRTPQVSLISRGELYASLNKMKYVSPSESASSNLNTSEVVAPMTLWDPSLEGRFRVHIVGAKNIVSKDAGKVFVKAGLFHGAEPLCGTQKTMPVSPDNLQWGEWLQFDLPLQEIPRAARLSISVCYQKKPTDKKKKKDKEFEVLLHSWGNLNLFNAFGELVHSRLVVPLCSAPLAFEQLLNPLGPTGWPLGSDTPSLEVDFESRLTQGIVYPSETQMTSYAKYINKLEGNHDASVEKDSSSPSSTIVSTIVEISMRDIFKQLDQEDKEFLWNNRLLCLAVPQCLPRLLDAIRWSSRDQVAQMYLLLGDWPLVPLETALQLLQGKYADLRVREHAVKSLEATLPDEYLSMYLLTLVHSLKHEKYLDSPLLRFLLYKSLGNSNIGNYFFWHLRAEIQNWPNPLRLVAVLEAYCRGLGPGLRGLTKQVEMLDKLSKVADSIRDKRDDYKERSRYLKKLLGEKAQCSGLQHMPSPLHPSHTLGKLRIPECRVLDSARRPLCLVWDNPDTMAAQYTNSHAVIFKNGDDLRQDMLTLQVFSIMAHLWGEEGLDLRMLPYCCMATGPKVGVIEVVRNAKTVYSIQKRAKLGAIQVDSSQLYKWIRSKNQGLRLDQAIDTFTRSCAGYCVATYVLGIGDRHPDNIMVNEEGQIFHIDFGHFLGNFKKKFGINRERVPFVLTQDFLRVIAAGAENPKESAEVQRFQELCGQAYLSLRKHSNLLITLFSLLLSTDMPELQSQDNIEYLCKTLAVDMSEEQALEYFQNQFHEAYGGAWTTKLDWFFHSVKHR
ncbi:phosphatidylinositol 4,5-bisphosphate 3-kinase catalytic subunit alpha isoform-like [Oratosquilla oratoria]|uniref:phosphatidylinositol 4,5-bisphosphate 3-kinase catalytic subunit alpha isoform-like n=1 Tax=Oratosquilla oratoria TaxID=337810 RepID=UPI003F75A18B